MSVCVERERERGASALCKINCINNDDDDGAHVIFSMTSLCICECITYAQ